MPLMPHLSPMFWTLALFIFTMNLLLLTSASWWAQAPSFPQLTQTLPSPNSWSWK